MDKVICRAFHPIWRNGSSDCPPEEGDEYCPSQCFHGKPHKRGADCVPEEGETRVAKSCWCIPINIKPNEEDL